MKKIDRYGETRVNTQGLKMRICKYNNVHDIDVEFEDGYISKNKHYTAFKKGNIENPNYNKANIINRIGETNYNNQNLKMTIINYNNNHDIDVIFDDGTIVKHKSYSEFIKGSIKNKCFSKYIGETSVNNNGLKMTIVDGNSYNNLIVKFEDGTIVKNINFKRFQEGNVSNPYYPSVCGVGFIGSSSSSENGILKKSYSVWSGMLNRCYNKKHPNKAYIGCSVCEEWYNYTNFEKWFDENYYTIDGEEIELDKDILIRGNKIYSPDTCIFVPKRINSLFISLNKNNNKTIGIDWKEKIHKYQIRCCFENDRKYIGVYSTEEESFNAYKQFKESYVKQIADKYKDKIPEKLYNAMYNWEV